MSKSSELRSVLAELVPAQHIVTRAWLLTHGIGRHTADNLVKRGDLVVVRRGVYANPGWVPSWESVVCSLQRMGSDLVVGGLSGLEVQGRSHYVPLGRNYAVSLFGREVLPIWTNSLGLAARFRRHGITWLEEGEAPTETEDSYGMHYPYVRAQQTERNGLRLSVSTPERAFFEVLSGVPTETSFDHAELLLEGLPDLLPKRLNRLIARTRSVKIKRLFFWLAKRQRHPWLKYVREDCVDFGRGKRHLAPNGRFNREYQITVPDSMSAETREIH